MHICRNSLHCTVLKNKIDLNEESGTKVSGSFWVLGDSKGDAYTKEPALYIGIDATELEEGRFLSLAHSKV